MGISQALSNEIKRVKEENEKMQIDLRYKIRWKLLKIRSINLCIQSMYEHILNTYLILLALSSTRHLNAEDITSLNIKELMDIENDLENGLINIGEKRV